MSQQHILLVEDDMSLATWISDYLEESGFSITHLSRGDWVVDAVKTHPPALILLDLMLPGMDGHQVCKRLREFYSGPIIVLTAKSDEFDEVLSLELGASDFVMKPVRPRALLTRMKTALQRSDSEQRDSAEQMAFGTLKLESSAKRAVWRGSELSLTAAEFDLLWLLASRAGEVVDRDTVFRLMKGWQYDGMDRRFDVLVSSLRKKVSDVGSKAKRIKTVWGRGYLFVPDAWD